MDTIRELYYGWWDEQESSKGERGRQIQACSRGLSDRDAMELKNQYCPYSDDLVGDYCSIGNAETNQTNSRRRFALYRRTEETAVSLASFFRNNEGRPTYRAHIVVGPQDLDVLTVLASWKSPDWLAPLPNGSNGLLPVRTEFLAQGSLRFPVEAGKLQSEELLRRLTFLLSAMMERDPEHPVVLLGEEDDLVTTLFVLFSFLPLSARGSVTFALSPLESPRRFGPSVVGITRIEAPEKDPFKTYVQGPVLGIDLETGRSSPNISPSPYANWCVQKVQDGHLAEIQQLLHVYDDAGLTKLQELNHLVAVEEARVKSDRSEAILPRLASAKLLTYYLKDVDTLDLLIGLIEEGRPKAEPIAKAIIGAHLTRGTLNVFAISFADSLRRWMDRGGKVEAISASADQFFETLLQDPDLVWRELFRLYSAGSTKQTGPLQFPTKTENRFWLLDKWQTLKEVVQDSSFNIVAEQWVAADPKSLLELMESKLPSELKLTAIQETFGNKEAFSHLNEKCFAVISKDAFLAREAFSRLAQAAWSHSADQKNWPAGIQPLALAFVDNLRWQDSGETDVYPGLRAARELLGKRFPKKGEDIFAVLDYLRAPQPSVDDLSKAVKVLKECHTRERQEFRDSILAKFLSGAKLVEFRNHFPSFVELFDSDARAVIQVSLGVLSDPTIQLTAIDKDLAFGISILQVAFDAASERFGQGEYTIAVLENLLKVSHPFDIPKNVIPLLARFLPVEGLAKQSSGLGDLLLARKDCLDADLQKRIDQVARIKQFLEPSRRHYVDFQEVVRAYEELDIDPSSIFGSHFLKSLIREAVSNDAVPRLLASQPFNPKSFEERFSSIAQLLRELEHDEQASADLVGFVLSCSQMINSPTTWHIPKSAVQPARDNLRKLIRKFVAALSRKSQRAIKKEFRKNSLNEQEILDLPSFGMPVHKLTSLLQKLAFCRHRRTK